MKTIQNPLGFGQEPIQKVLRQLASQENCDGAPYDQMMQAADYIEELERERDELRNQLRAMVNAKGRYNTQIAMEKLIGLLPENTK